MAGRQTSDVLVPAGALVRTMIGIPSSRTPPIVMEVASQDGAPSSASPAEPTSTSSSHRSSWPLYRLEMRAR